MTSSSAALYFSMSSVQNADNSAIRIVRADEDAVFGDVLIFSHVRDFPVDVSFGHEEIGHGILRLFPQRMHRTNHDPIPSVPSGP